MTPTTLFSSTTAITMRGEYADKTDLNHYALTDHQFSVVARVNQIGTLVDRIAYTPYGEARHQWYNDVNGDGEVNAADNTAASNASGNAIYQSNYNVDADFDRDGDVDSNDVALTGSTYYKAALPGGWIGLDGSAHTIGYCGYVFNQESGLYTVRFRHYDPVWGRWISRDPAGYMDSMSLYGYGWGSPLWGGDPLGLAWWNPWTWGEEDREWEEMMRRNQEMLRKKLESQRDRGIISDEQYAREVWEMRNMLDTVMLELALIEAEAKVLALRGLRDIAIAAIPISAFVAAGGRVILLLRLGKFSPAILWIGIRGRSVAYSVDGVWYLGFEGITIIPRAKPLVSVPIPILSNPAVPRLGEEAAETCVGSACRAICKGWGG